MSTHSLPRLFMRFIVLPVIRFWINYQKGRRHARVDIELHNVWWARCIR